MVYIKPEHSAGLGGGTKGYLLSIGGYPPPSDAFWAAYNLETGTWANLTTPAPYTSLEGHSAVVDPSTGLVYVMGGFNGDKTSFRENSTVSNLLTVFDPKTAKVVEQTPATIADNMTGASVLWSTRRNSVLRFRGSRVASTGNVTALEQTSIDEYSPTTKQWTTMETKGTFPQRRLDACALESEDGSKIVLFGGAADVDVIHGSIHILDVTTGQWTAGQSVPLARTQISCAFHAGQFIVFGGTQTKDQRGSQITAQPIVFDVNKNQWISSYNPAGTGGSNDGSNGSNPGSPDNDPNTPTTDKTSNLGAIICGVVAGVILIVFVVGGIIYRRRRRERKDAEADARAAAMLSARESDSNEKRNPQNMTAAEHYAAAQAAAQLQAAREAAAGRLDGDKRTHSWSSENLSQVTSSENDSSIILMNAAKARRLSDAPIMDPAACYRHLLNHQNTSNQAAVNIGPFATMPLDTRLHSPHSALNQEEMAAFFGSSNTGPLPPPALSIQTSMQPWVAPMGIRELIVADPPGSPQDWQIGGDERRNGSTTILGRMDGAEIRQQQKTPVTVERAISMALKEAPADPARAPHTFVTDSAMEVILSPTPVTK
ncbi:hypothetical protein BGX23_007374 [Mortierella sp. AD031]|nr:hypothetical protein BGX23_007374 [Mortierella sp. AD031]